jgi:hypothetical protein
MPNWTLWWRTQLRQFQVLRSIIMVVSTRIGSRIQIRSRSDLHHRAGNNRAHSPQDLTTIRNRIDRRGCNRNSSASDELRSVMQIEIDTKLLTGDLDQDIEILNVVA